MEPLDRTDIPVIEMIEESLKTLRLRIGLAGRTDGLDTSICNKIETLEKLMLTLRIRMAIELQCCPFHGTALNDRHQCSDCFEVQNHE